MNTLTTYTTNVRAAIDAYAADQAVAEGLCAACKRRPKDRQTRRCWQCTRDHATENGTSQ